MTASPELARELGVPLAEWWETIGSTSDRAAELAADDCPPGTVVLAREQTAGRGRRGRAWCSEADRGVWLSLVLRGSDVDARLPLVVGVACAVAVEDHGARDVEIKWPNDLMVEGRKLGGVLCESRAGGLIVGIGVNLQRPAHVPDGSWDHDVVALEELAYASRGETDFSLDPIDVTRSIVKRVLSVTGAPTPWSDSYPELQHRDALRDRALVSETVGVGVGRGIDHSGALVLEREDGSRVRVVSGSVRLAHEVE